MGEQTLRGEDTNGGGEMVIWVPVTKVFKLGLHSCKDDLFLEILEILDFVQRHTD